MNEIHQECRGATMTKKHVNGHNYVLCVRCGAFVWDDHPAWPLLPSGTDRRENDDAWHRSDPSSPCREPPGPVETTFARRWAALGELGRKCVSDELERQEYKHREQEAILRIIKD